MESRLGRMCETVRRRKNLWISWQDLGGGNLERAANYLDMVGEVEHPNRAKQWQTVKAYGQLRSLIVHNGAKIYKTNEDLWSIAKRKSLLAKESSTDGAIETTPNFCKEVLRVTKEFLIHVQRKVAGVPRSVTRSVR